MRMHGLRAVRALCVIIVIIIIIYYYYYFAFLVCARACPLLLLSLLCLVTFLPPTGKKTLEVVDRDAA